MKRSELLSEMIKAGCFFVRHGSRHDVWKSPKGDIIIVPRHAKEIPTGTAAKIRKDAGII